MRGRNANYGPLAESVKYAPQLRPTIEQGLSLKRCTKRLSAARRRKKSSGWCASARSCAVAVPKLNCDTGQVLHALYVAQQTYP